MDAVIYRMMRAAASEGCIPPMRHLVSRIDWYRIYYSPVIHPDVLSLYAADIWASYSSAEELSICEVDDRAAGENRLNITEILYGGTHTRDTGK